MDAAATPLPREETTPPVTKIYFGPIRTGYAPLNRLLGAKLSFSSRKSKRTAHFTEKCAGVSTRPRRPRTHLLHALHVSRRLHFYGFVLRFRHANAIAVLQPPKLLQLLDALQIALREGGKFQERLAPENIQPHMLQMRCMNRSFPVSHPRYRRPRKIKCVPVEVQHRLHHIR